MSQEPKTSALAWLDCPSGIAGDMILAALLDAGLPMGVLDDVIQRLGLEGVEVRAQEIHRGGLRSLLVDVDAPSPGDEAAGDHHHTPHVHLSTILDRIEGSGLPEPVTLGASRVFRRLAEAEARVHGTSVEEVHFHEVGAVDAQVDVVGAVAGFFHFGLLDEEGRARAGAVVASPLPLGHGSIVCAHGRIPLPGPAVVEMLPGVPSYGVDVAAETVTPTGIAILTGLELRFGVMPAMLVGQVGRGSGHRELPLPGPLRLMIGKPPEAEVVAGPALLPGVEPGRNLEIEVTIDDMNPEWVPGAIEAIMAAGALDVSVAQVLMKKGRPGLRLSALCDDEAERSRAVATAILRHTSSIGLRVRQVEKWALPRHIEQVETPWGPVSVKVVSLDGEELRVTPEHEDVRRLAEGAGLPLSVVYDASVAAWRERS